MLMLGLQLDLKPNYAFFLPLGGDSHKLVKKKFKK